MLTNENLFLRFRPTLFPLLWPYYQRYGEGDVGGETDAVAV
jgi:hypothetical protein